MSTYVMGLVWPLLMPPSQKAVLISLADQCNDQGVCWPAIRTLAVRTCLSDRTVQLALRGLEEAGLLQVDYGAHKSNRYTVMLAALRAAAEAPRPAESGFAWVKQMHPEAAAGGESAAGGGAAASPGGCSSCTQTVIEPIPNTPQPPTGGKGAENAENLFGDALPPSAKPPGKRREAMTLRQFLDACKAVGEEAIPAADPVYRVAERIGLPKELLWLAWRWFRRKYLPLAKRQRDWRRHFRNAVEGNWGRLWLTDPGGGYRLTTEGIQAKRLIEAEAEDQDNAREATPA